MSTGVAYHHHNLHLKGSNNQPDIKRLELSIWLHTFARSLISIFVPIILLNTGYSVKQILLYLLVYNLFDVPLNFVVYKLVKKIGAINCMILGTFFTILFFGILGIIPSENFLLLNILSFAAAAYDTLFWVSHIYIFMEISKNDMNMGKTVGLFESIRRFGNIPGPLIGAFILLNFGDKTLSLLSIIIFIVSIYPLYKIKNFINRPIEQNLNPRIFFRENPEKINFVLTFLLGLHDEVESIILPIYIYVTFSNIEKVAFIPVIVSVIAVALSYYAGILTKKYETKMAIFSAAVISTVWIFRVFIADPQMIYLSTFIINAVMLFLSIPLNTNLNERGKITGTLSSATYRNAISMAPKAFLYILLLFVPNAFSVSFFIALVTMPFVYITIQKRFALHTIKN